MIQPTPAAAEFLAVRDFVLEHRTDYEAALRGFRWPQLHNFNWALDYFDLIAAGNHRTALHLVDEDGVETIRSFSQLSEDSNRVANYMRSLKARRGDRMMLMLGNEVALWEALLAAMKIGLVVTPATTLLTAADLQDRIDRGRVRYVIAGASSSAKVDSLRGPFRKIVVNGTAQGWEPYNASRESDPEFRPTEPTLATDPLLLYFTSGTTSQPKLVMHTHQSYPVGHLSTLYWLGLQPDDRHWNISSPGWAKHAWSCFFAPWNAEATVFIFNYTRFHAKTILNALVKYRATTLCAPPTVWRMLIQERLAEYAVSLREVVSAGEPLNPEIVGYVQKSWGLTIRDGYGQTETTALVGNSPGQPLKAGSMGRPLPGYPVALLDPNGNVSDKEGEICLRLDDRPLGLTEGYAEDDRKTSEAMRGGYYHTGDIASRDVDGYLTFVGRDDDVFKASDYRISPFELESVLIEHPAVAEAAVVPSPDPVRYAVPKAFVVLAPGFASSRDVAADILAYCRGKLAPYKRIRRIEFAELPKTISGKIRRVELRAIESQRRAAGKVSEAEFFEEDLKD